jgi:ATP-binding protein involved in chromosome partitioning
MNNHLTRLEEAVARALNALKDPLTGRGLIDSGRVQGLTVNEQGRVGFTIEAPGDLAANFQKVRDTAESTVKKLSGVRSVMAVLTAEAAPRRQAPQRAAPAAQGVPGVGAIVAVASAKGGVGKSTVAVNLACALAGAGQHVGLLDADVYGPSLPTLLGLIGKKPAMGADKKLDPIEVFGVKAMSIGFLVDPEAPMIWRGAMATSALRQLLDDVHWAPLDILVIDMPPGTGDVQLTLAQRVPLSGAVIVSTPQEVALADVRRGIAMFEKTHVPVLGVVENMAYYEASGGERVAIFGEGGARRTAETAGVPFLGELPIDVSLRESGDAGAPLAALQPDSPMARRFRDLAALTLARLAEGQKPAPKITVV